MKNEDLGFDGFDWDEGNRDKCRKHVLSIEEIEDLLLTSEIDLYRDDAHSGQEERIKAIGVVANRRHCLIVFTRRERRGKSLIRPISARYMHRKEVESYEEEIARSQE